MKLSEIAGILNGELIGDPDTEVLSAGKIESAEAQDITFIANPVYEKYVSRTDAAAIIVSKKFSLPDNKKNKNLSLIRVDDPYLSFLKVLEMITPKPDLIPEGVHDSSVIMESAELSEHVSVGANCYIGANCKIGKGTKILPNTVLLNGVQVGLDVLIYSNVTVYHGCRIGDRVIIHSGTVIGCDGFGQARNPDGSFKKIPQTGIVVIDDDVEVGSNCSIDRATMGETKLCKGVKLDNQIQIAHNVFIGENTVIAAHSGIAGSTKIGKNCMLGGKVGVVGHIEICDNVIITAASNVSKSITEPGTYSGYRAQPIKKELREQAELRRKLKGKF
jgi:UDP-3-O-[3-hydroxymyristoyl] glucosamine N-acyltransferase